MHTNRSGPIVYVYTVCHNEALLLPYFLRHYGSFAEKVIVYDNQSTDGSADIAGSWPKTEVRTLDSGNELRDDLLLEVKNNCWKESRGKADLVIVCDVSVPFPHPSISEALRRGWGYCVTSSGILNGLAHSTNWLRADLRRDLRRGEGPMVRQGRPFQPQCDRRDQLLTRLPQVLAQRAGSDH